MRFRHVALAGLLASLASTALAVDVGDGKLTLHGSGSWAYERTDENVYYGDEDGDYATARFDLALTANPTDRVVIATQLGFDAGVASVEWVFAEWRFSDKARFRIGQVNQPLGNYMELQFVGTTRPFFELPTSVYGPADIGAPSYYGVGITGDLALGGGDWTLQYDAYGGALQLATYEPFEVLEPGHDPAVQPELEEVVIEDVVGGRLSLVAPSGLTFRLSGYAAPKQRSEGRQLSQRFVAGLSALFRGERLWLSVEGFGHVEPRSESQVSAYAELAWFLTPNLQVAGRYDFARTELDEVSGGSPLLRHDEVAVGLNWWFSPDFVLKVSAHRVEGTRFVFPAEGATVAQETTNLVFAGAQFTF